MNSAGLGPVLVQKTLQVGLVAHGSLKLVGCRTTATSNLWRSHVDFGWSTKRKLLSWCLEAACALHQTKKDAVETGGAMTGA